MICYKHNFKRAIKHESQFKNPLVPHNNTFTNIYKKNYMKFYNIDKNTNTMHLFKRKLHDVK